ncbi:hypothetical protein BRPE64_ACDS14070 [Caballeronia insecticola]|uniref:Uncharacterized protein n=1 Tax=Caballeronia insecticola TaxID=758793 RepID=R4WW22_9BURK|nr:hypothetical protein BRPE64_ACDS14070 [Caballeronia insecticola]
MVCARLRQTCGAQVRAVCLSRSSAFYRHAGRKLEVCCARLRTKALKH